MADRRFPSIFVGMKHPAGALLAVFLTLLASVAAAADGPRFRVSVGADAGTTPVTGRLIVIVSPTAEPEPRTRMEIWNASPMFGVDVEALRPGKGAVVDARAAAFPMNDLRALPAGDYFVQALLIRYTEVQRADGHRIWVTLPPATAPNTYAPLRPGNLHSAVRRLRLDAARGFDVELTLSEVIAPASPPPDTEWLKTVLIKSEILSRFWGVPIHIGARVLLPRGFEDAPEARYPAIYVFGHGTPFFFNPDPASHGPALRRARDANLQTGYEFYQSWISDGFPRVVALCPIIASPYFDESYVLDSANNGPWGQAITQELIPHLEKTFRLAAQPSARIVEGASTGGWEALALQLHYPDFFGGAWVFNPDPIDFTRYALSDVYKDENFFSTEVTPWVSAERSMLRNREGQVTWTARQVAQFEAVLGTKGRSNYQLDIWQATHGPVGADGYPALLFDKKTGVIDRKVADYMRERGFDLTEHTRRNWATLGPKLSGKLHFFSGEQDEFFLNLGVYKFEEMLAQMDNPRADASFAYGRPKKGHNWHLTDFAQMVRDMAAHVARNERRALTLPTAAAAPAASSASSVPADASPAALAQRQLAAYNARDLEAFLAVYSDDVEIHAFPGRRLYKGKDRMRERYAKLFADSPRLHCELVHRTVHGNVVIDQERVTGVRGDAVIEASAVYTIASDRIVRVDFVQ